MAGGNNKTMSKRRTVRVFARIVLAASLALFLPLRVAFSLNPDVCIGAGGPAECTGSEATQYKYGYVSSQWNGYGPFASEQAAVSHFQNAVANVYRACSTNLDNPSWQALPSSSTGTGDVHIPEPPVPGGPNFSLAFIFSTEMKQTKHEIRVTGTAATDGNPPCANPITSGRPGC
jgi:hypothetical protein